MNGRLRQFLFWPHLVGGLVAGLIIFSMSVTGLALALGAQVIAWADRDSHRLETPSPSASRLSVDAMLTLLQSAHPGKKPTEVTLYAEPTYDLRVSLGRSDGVYVDPYTGEIREWGAVSWRRFFRLMEDWHRWLGMTDGQRAVGRGITGFCNA